ncbi:MAG: pyruvate dehydrogenase complex dihydrolipoamide acetyltransferase [Saprospiraceae bacterium]|nr:pyruvate dehydrogenase complex dihydrolipoamide acetyltransferase [Saprospiraceae bacterium]
MAEVIRMPRMSDTMEEGNIVGWLKEEGEVIEAGETIAEVETDKATMELDSFVDGVLLHIAVKEGPVPIDGVIAVVGEKGEDWQAAIAAAGSSNGSAEAEAPATEEAPKPAETAAPAPAASTAAGDDKRLKASPLAKSMAKEAGIDISTLQGSGDQGRIVKKDVEAAIANPPAAPAPAPAAAPAAKEEKAAPPPVVPFTFGGGEANYEDTPVSQMRKTIARRLGESKFTAPHFYLTIDINMDKAVALRKRLKEVSPAKVSFNDLVIKAAAAALREHPAINSSWLGDSIRTHQDIHIGVAVAVPDGLLVPVIRYANMKTLSQINSEVRHLAGKAKDKKLQPAEMQGNTFTISNLGMFGIEEFTAIINPPDACILAVGTIVQKPIVKDGQIVVGNMMKVTLSCDHRVVDGATGAQFLQTFQEILEDPIRLLV